MAKMKFLRKISQFESRQEKMDLPKDIVEIAAMFHEKGKDLYVVGGAVRDYLMGKEPKDFDLATNATPDESLDILKKKYRTLEVGKNFGVVKAVTKKFPEGVEIATFRSDIGKGRRPDAVEFTSIDKDVLRRDLTINALFYDIVKGEIVDLVGGTEDIKNSIVRTVGNPEERFDEDPLRKLRAVRFAARMGARIDRETERALMRDNSLKGVSEERIRDEFVKILKSALSIKAGMQMIENFDFFPQIFPKLECEPSNTLQGLDYELNVALLLLENAPQKVDGVMRQMKWTNEEVEKVVFLLKMIDLTPETAFRLKKRQKIARVSDDELLSFGKRAKALRREFDYEKFIRYNITSKGTQISTETGLEGAALGKEIERREKENFLKA
jgi:tRNA nucleotidyltransferase/poly(A) polymerase